MIADGWNPFRINIFTTHRITKTIHLRIGIWAIPLYIFIFIKQAEKNNLWFDCTTLTSMKNVLPSFFLFIMKYSPEKLFQKLHTWDVCKKRLSVLYTYFLLLILLIFKPSNDPAALYIKQNWGANKSKG